MGEDNNDALSESQMNTVLDLLTTMVKKDLIGENKFDVKNIEAMLGNFPGANMAQALALSTKIAYDNTLECLNRTTRDTSTTNVQTNAENQKYNDEVQECVGVFVSIMKDDTYTHTSYCQKGQYGVTRNGLNALEAVLLMTFGGVAGVAPGLTDNGHTVSGQEARYIQKTWDSVDNTSLLVDDHNGTNALPIESMEARAVYLMALWAKYDMVPVLFGSQRNQIVVKQVIDTSAGAACCQTYCGTYQLAEEQRAYDLWDNSVKGMNHFTSTVGTILATSFAVGGVTSHKILGGESAFTTAMLNRTLSTGEKFSQTQLGAALRISAIVTRNMTIEQLDTAWNMGYNTLAHLNIVTTGGSFAHPAVPTELVDATVVSYGVTGATKRYSRTTTSPYIFNVLGSKFRKLFLKEVLADDGDVHPQALSTAIDIAQMRAADKAFVVGTSNNRKGSSVAQAMPGALALINEVRGYYSKASFDDYWTPDGNSYLSEHDKPGRAMTTTMLAFLADTMRTPAGTGTAAELLETLFEREVYTKYADRYDVNSDGTLEGQLSSSDIVGVNSHFKVANRDTTQAIIGKIVLRQFKLSPSTFVVAVLPTLLKHMQMPSSGLDPITGGISANMHEAFGIDSPSDTRWGQLFAGNSIDNFRRNATGYAHESALVYFFMLSKLTPAELSEALANSATRVSNGTQLAQLLKYTKATESAPSKLELKHNSGSYKIRNGADAASWAEADLIQDDLWNTSGNLTNRIIAGKGYTANSVTYADHANIKDAKKALVDQIIAVRFFGLGNSDKETARINLINGYQITAAKLQKIAGADSSIVEDYNSGSAIDLTEANGLTTIVDVTYKSKIENPIFVKAAFMSLAKSQGYYAITASEIAAKDKRDENFINAINKALEGSEELQQKEFFIAITKLAANSASGNEEKTYKNLATSIHVMLGEELQDEEGSTAYHVLGGWKTNAEAFTAKENRSILAAAITETLKLGIIHASPASKINDLTEEGEKANTDYDVIHSAVASGKKLLRIAKICAGVVDKGNTLGLFELRTEVSTTGTAGAATVAGSSIDLKNKRNILMCYLAGLIYEVDHAFNGIYDSEDMPAGLTQPTVNALIVDGGFTEEDFTNTHHPVIEESEGDSATQVKRLYKNHRFLAHPDGVISAPQGFDTNEKPAYTPINVNHLKPRTV